MFHLNIKRKFAAAHRLEGYNGECASLHGHNWTVEVEVAGERLDECGMLIDFKDLKRMVDGIISELDHKYLNEIVPFDRGRGGANPTAENIAAYIYKGMKVRLDRHNNKLLLREVKVWESTDAWACCREDE